MDLRDRIPRHYAEILPICPCGCEGLMHADRPIIRTPDYVHVIRESGEAPELSELGIEAEVIRRQSWIETPLAHWMRYYRLAFPWMVHDPNLVRMCRDTLRCEERKKRIFSMMGHASSGKTNFIVLDAFASIMLWPGNSECFVASPYRSASEYLLWRSFGAAADMLEAYGRTIYRKSGVLSLRRDCWSGPGTITLVSFHAVGVLRGKKLLHVQDEAARGRLGVYLDEAGEFTNDTILHIIANLKSQPGLRVRTGTNFRRIDGLDGKFHEPQNFQWSDLSRETSYSWDAVNGGYSMRLRAKVSPNIVLEEDYYPYLLRKGGHDDLLQYGVDSVHYLSQGDAFPSVESVNRLIINDADIQAGGVYGDVELAKHDQQTFAFLDPSFTQHGDSAIVSVGTLGRDTASGEWKIRCDKQVALQVNGETVWDERFLTLARKLRSNKGLADTFVEGALITAFDLCALLVGEFLLAEDIPFSNMAYDDSLRGSVTYSMVYFLGEGVEGVHYNGRPTNKLTFPPQYKWGTKQGTKVRLQVRMRSDELYNNIVGQMWLNTVAMIKAGYIRNGYCMEKAFGQMRLRLKTEAKSGQSNVKLSIESKGEFKDRNRQQSPDQADSFCGLVWMIVDRKLAPVADASEASFRGGVMAASSIQARIEAGDIHRQHRVQRLSR